MVGVLSVQIHQGYGTSAFDIGLYDQGLWLLSHFKAPFVTLMGRNLFGDHTSFTLLLLVPLYWIHPDPSTLLVVQALVLAVAAVPVYMLALKRTNSVIIATVLAAALLLHPALAESNMENYHPELVPRAVHRTRDRRRGSVEAAAFRGRGQYWQYSRRGRCSSSWCRSGSGTRGAATAKSVCRSPACRCCGRVRHECRDALAHRRAHAATAGRIPFGGSRGLCRGTVTKPGDVAKYLYHDNRPWYVWQMLAPTGLVFMLAPEVAAIGVLGLASNVVSNFLYQHLIGYHYVMPILPALAMGTVFAVSKMRTQFLRYAATALVGVAAITTAYMWGPYSFSCKHIADWSPSYYVVHEIDAIRKQVPPNAVLSSYHAYVPAPLAPHADLHLAHSVQRRILGNVQAGGPAARVRERDPVRDPAHPTRRLERRGLGADPRRLRDRRHQRGRDPVQAHPPRPTLRPAVAPSTVCRDSGPSPGIAPSTAGNQRAAPPRRPALHRASCVRGLRRVRGSDPGRRLCGVARSRRQVDARPDSTGAPPVSRRRTVRP